MQTNEILIDFKSALNIMNLTEPAKAMFFGSSSNWRVGFFKGNQSQQNQFKASTFPAIWQTLPIWEVKA